MRRFVGTGPYYEFFLIYKHVRVKGDLEFEKNYIQYRMIIWSLIIPI